VAEHLLPCRAPFLPSYAAWVQNREVQRAQGNAGRSPRCLDQAPLTSPRLAMKSTASAVPSA
jgi:hypothetical protein